MDAALDLVGGSVVLVEIVAQGRDGQFDRLDGGRVDLVAMLFHRFLGRVDEAFGLVAGLDQFATGLVGLGIVLGVLDHLFDVFVGETAGGLDRDLVLFASAFVLGLNRDDAVGVDVEGHLDLRHAARCGRDVLEVELTEHLVVGRHFTFALEDPDRHGRLVVLGGGEDLALVGGDRGVAVDQTGEDTAQRFDAERQRGHVEQHNILDVALQNTGLDGGAHGHHFVGVDALVGLFAEEFGDFLDDLGHPGLTTDEHDLVNVAGRETGILERGLAGLERGFDQVAHEAFELGTGQFHDHVQRLTVRPHRDEGLVDFGLARARELDLGLFCRFLETLQGHLVFGQVDAVLFFELVGEVVDDAHVKVFTAKERVAIGGFDFEEAFVDLENGHVEGPAAEVIDRDRVGFVLVETIGQRGRGRLVDDAQHFETGDLAGVFGGLTLGVVEIGGNGNDRLGHFLAEIAFGCLFHLAQDERTDLARRVFLTAGLDPGVAVAAVDDVERHVLLVLGQIRVVGTAADQTFDAKDGVFRVGDSLAFGRLTNEPLAICKCDDRRRGAGTFRVLDHARLAAVHDGNAGIGCTEVNPDHFRHVFDPFFLQGDCSRPGPVMASGHRSFGMAPSRVAHASRRI
ncbi:Glutamate dehydrogenase [Roseovarius nubinhibens ISM]|uniref:Glutamate dehydrogenase n=1 Tax=Roseovarius nubinhibens (strain ATCC BAA-591 / DSM 15170 / ISM) TaxID=89187 RepID=A3SLT2_ROSNI|nr:Glutamate dehydrogenase [Roseovarius nubinhibens ISM]